MAYFVGLPLQTISAASASFTASLQSGYQTNDILKITISQDGGGTTIAPDAAAVTAGWVIVGGAGGQAASAGSRQVIALCRATSGAMTNPTFTGANDEWIADCRIIRDVDTAWNLSTLVSGTDYIRADYDLTAVKGRATSGALTTATANCLLAYSWCLDTGGTGGAALRASPDEIYIDSSFGNNLTATTIYHLTGHLQMGAAGAAPTAYCYANIQDGGNGWIVAFPNASGGKLQADVRAGCTPIKWYGNFGNTFETLTFNVANNLTTDTINSIAVSSDACTVAHTGGDASNPPGLTTTITTDESTSGSWQGIAHDITTTNMSGKVFSVQWVTSGLSSPVGAEGWLVVFSDGTNWVAYRLGYPALVGLVADIPQRAVIALGAATAYASSASAINWSAVTKIGYFQHRVGSVATARSFSIKNAMLWDTARVIGGNSIYPVQLSQWADAMFAAGIDGVQTLQGEGQLLGKSKLQIGDGATPTYFDLSPQAFAFPLAYSATDIKRQWNANASSVGVTIKASASDILLCSAGIFATSTAQPFTIHADSSVSASYSFSGASIVGWDVTLKAGITASNATFKSGGKIAAKGANLTDVTVAKTTATDAAINWDTSGAVVTRTTIDLTGSTTDYHVELGTSVTAITLTDVTFIGTPGTDKVHVLATTGTVTITISGTTNLVAGDVTSAGATVVIDAPQVYQSVTISNLVAGSRVQIYDTTSSTELSNSVVGGTSVTWTDSNPASETRAIRVRIAYVSGATAKHFIEASIGTCGVTEGTEAVSYLANQTDDDVYVANAVDGSGVAGVTFTDSATDLVNVNVPGGTISWGQIYAATAYWLFGATGVANDIAMIDAPDPANYRFSAMKVKNTSSGPVVPLKITGGYGYDATTGSIADVIDTSAGSIFPMPDHVVSSVITVSGGDVITGDISTVLAAIPSASTNAAAVLTAAQSAPIHSEIKKVAGATIDGSGTEADPWGPA